MKYYRERRVYEARASLVTIIVAGLILVAMTVVGVLVVSDIGELPVRKGGVEWTP